MPGSGVLPYVLISRTGARKHESFLHAYAYAYDVLNFQSIRRRVPREFADVHDRARDNEGFSIDVALPSRLPGRDYRAVCSDAPGKHRVPKYTYK